jgi:hypothetical protein
MIGDKPRQGKRQGQAAKRPDPPFKEYYGSEKTSGKERRKWENKDKPTGSSLDIHCICRRAKPNKYGRGLYYFRSGLAQSVARQASLDLWRAVTGGRSGPVHLIRGQRTDVRCDYR